MRRNRFLAPLLVAASLLATAPAHGQPAPAAVLASDEAQRIALDAYVYVYPLVVMDLSRRQDTGGKGPGHAPANTFAHERRLPQADFRRLPRPNFDMLRSSAWLDLSTGPVVISTPETHGRLYTLSVLDMWTDIFAVLGKRTTGTARGNHAIVPPGWTGVLPRGMHRIDAPTAQVQARLYVQTGGSSEYPGVHAVQDGFILTPLAEWNQQAQSVRLRSDPDLDALTPAQRQVEGMNAEDYFGYAAELLRKHAPHATDQPMLARLRRLGIAPGQQLAFARLPTTVQQALRHAVRNGPQALRDSLPATGSLANGWQADADGAGVYGNAYLRRAVTTQARLGASLPEDVTAMLLLADAAGRPLEGGQRYVLRFEADQLPPAGALWSLNAYDAQGYPVGNGFNRYALGDRDPVRYNPDGSLELYLQRNPPGPDDQANWLPTGEGAPGVILRIYLPQASVLAGRWVPPAARRVEAADD
ncbi:PF06863 family protein [Bordetella bronchiseptica E012]|uniref:DUF1254 domain-containing protein n=1 Tax=Bordetella bronchiseptica TaxID=518 RepID=UPI0004614A0A|nr:DUF1254 domain-containing protein [Bordetella bronchiseptica]KDC06105.1 PF06863 family protein [Bordetella bronchiseptica E012]